MSKRSTIPLSSINEGFYVRASLDEDHVLHLASLYEGGAKLPPLLVSRDGNVLIDGRHRLSAMKLLDKKAVDVEWSDETEASDLLVSAMKANIGGSLPPTNADITFAMRQMLENSMTSSQIMKAFESIWPPAVIRRFISDAQSAVIKERTLKAKTAVVDGNMTVAEAAAQFKIKPEQLKAAMGSTRKRKNSAAEYKGVLTSIFRSRGGSMGNTMRKVQRQLEDGELPWAACEQIIEHLEKCTRATFTSAKEWEDRLRSTHKRMQK